MISLSVIISFPYIGFLLLLDHLALRESYHAMFRKARNIFLSFLNANRSQAELGLIPAMPIQSLCPKGTFAKAVSDGIIYPSMKNFKN
jgi:hypothetical protein